MKKISKKLGAIILSLVLVLVITPVATLFGGCGLNFNNPGPEENEEPVTKIYIAYKALGVDLETGILSGTDINIGDPWDYSDVGVFDEAAGIATLYEDGTCVISTLGVSGIGTYTDTTITVKTQNAGETGEANYIFDGETLTVENTVTEGSGELTVTISRNSEYIYSLAGSAILVLKEKVVNNSQDSLFGSYVTVAFACEIGGADYNENKDKLVIPDTDNIWLVNEFVEDIEMFVEYCTLITVFCEDNTFLCNAMGGGMKFTYEIDANDPTWLTFTLNGFSDELRYARIQEDGKIYFNMGSLITFLEKVDTVTTTNG